MPEIGDTLGRYTLLKRLAVGGMGEVYVAAKPGPVGFGPFVALKVLREELASDRQFVEMLVDEANISMFLNHQNVVSVLDLGEDEGAYYIAMEFVQGVTVEKLLEATIQEGKTLPIPLSLHIIIELCRALKYAHTRVDHEGQPLNIIHRDVTPANILLSVQGEVKLTDFGIARARGRIHQTQAGVLKGKFGYMAPEMVRYEQIDGRADLFCAGVVLYMMLASRHPVHGAAMMEAIDKFENRKVDPPSMYNREIDKALDTIVMRCLEPKSKDRWSSAAALCDALQDILLQRSEWRAVAREGPRHVSDAIREVSPEVYKPVVSAEETERLLKAVAPARRKTRPRLPSGPVNSEEPASIPGRPSPVESLTDDHLPALEGDSETDDSLRASDVAKVQEGLQADAIADTDESPPGDSADVLPALSFDDSTTGRRKVRDGLLDEPEMPGAIAGTAPEPSAFEATIAAPQEQTMTSPPGMAMPDMSHAEVLDAPTVEASAADGDFGDQTLLGVAAPAWDADNGPVVPSVQDSSDLEAATALAPAASDPSSGRWDLMTEADEGLQDDATLLDGIHVDDVRAVVAAGKAALPKVAEVDLDSSATLADGDMKFVRPASAASAQIQPTPIAGPLRIVVDDGRPSLAEGAGPEEPAETIEPAGPTLPAGPDFQDAAGELPGTPPGTPGDATGRWLQGELGADALAWDDEAAARRLISTRNTEEEPPPAAFPPQTALPQHPSNSQMPQLVGPSVPQQSLLKRQGVLLFAIFALVAFLGATAYGWFGTRVFWPLVKLSTTPAGAAVVVDGQRLTQRTPITVKVTPGQRHTIEFELLGHRTAQREITDRVSRLGKYTLTVPLERVVPKVELLGNVVEATVKLQGKPVGVGTSVPLNGLPAEGPVELRVEAKGYVPYVVTFPSASQIPEVLSVSLKASPDKPKR